MVRRAIAAFLGAVAIAAPRVLEALGAWETHRQAAALGLMGPSAAPIVPIAVALGLGIAAAWVVLRAGRRGAALVAAVVTAHALAEEGAMLRAVDRGRPTEDAVDRLEEPDGTSTGGAAALLADRAYRRLAEPLAPIVLAALAVAVAAVGASDRRWLPRGPRALGIAAGGTALAVLWLSLWSQRALPRDGALADELIFLSLAVALAAALRTGPRAIDPRSLATVALVPIGFAIAFGFAHGWKETRRLCWAAGSTSYDRDVREHALARARARLRSPIAWLPDRVFPVSRDCDRAARALGVP